VGYVFEKEMRNVVEKKMRAWRRELVANRELGCTGS
jgi:hypothetical protein